MSKGQHLNLNRALNKKRSPHRSHNLLHLHHQIPHRLRSVVKDQHKTKDQEENNRIDEENHLQVIHSPIVGMLETAETNHLQNRSNEEGDEP